MINFISAYDENYEDIIYNELGINANSLNEFINKDHDEIENIIKNISNSKKTAEYVIEKLLLISSIIFNQRSFKYDEKNKKVFKRVLELIEKKGDISAMIKLYYILPENSPFKADHLQYLFNKEEIINHVDALKELIYDFYLRKENLTKQDFANVYVNLGKLVVKHKLFNLLTIKDNATFTNLLESNLSHDVIKIYFYNMFNVFTFDSYKTDLNKVISKLDDDTHTNEKLVLDAIINNNLGYLSKVNSASLDEIYGKKSHVILRSARLRIVYQTFEKVIAPEVSFSELETKFGIKVDELEELLYEGYTNGLFSLVIDYERDVVKVNYVRKTVYTKENINLMKEKIENLRNKINGIVSKIDNITV